MNHKIRTTAALVLACSLLASIPAVAYAGGPLLSGYGGPGAGEQAIIGSTLIGGARGGGSGGAGGADAGGPASAAGGGHGAGTAGESYGSTTTTTTTTETPTNAPVGGVRGAGSASSRSPSQAAHRRSSRAAFVYPNPRRASAGDSSVIGISAADVFPIVGIVAILTLIGVLTVRFARL
jgi:hypothetical protein